MPETSAEIGVFVIVGVGVRVSFGVGVLIGVDVELVVGVRVIVYVALGPGVCVRVCVGGIRGSSFVMGTEFNCIATVRFNSAAIAD